MISLSLPYLAQRKTAISTFITWFLAALLLVSVISPANPQTSPSPQSTPSSSGVPVVFDGKTLFFISNRLGTRSPEQRSQRANEIIGKFARDYTLSLDDLQVTSVDEEGIPLSEIIAGSNIITYISEQDAKSAGKTRAELANEYRQKIRSAGSTAVISNIISGTVLIYTRSFRIGDYIKVNNIYGKVIETTLLVTRVLTNN